MARTLRADLNNGMGVAIPLPAALDELEDETILGQIYDMGDVLAQTHPEVAKIIAGLVRSQGVGALGAASWRLADG